LGLLVSIATIGCNWFGVSDDPNHIAALRTASSQLSFTRYGTASSLACRNSGRTRSGQLHVAVSTGFRIVDDTCTNHVLDPGGACTLGVVADLAGSGALTLQAAPGGRVAVVLASAAHVVVTPAAPRLHAGERLRLATDVPVEWSVAEGDVGGSIDSDGQYTAPLVPGAYHVVAGVRSDPSQRATIAVTVDDWALELVAGELGGVGSADGVGEDARFWLPSGMASDGKGNLYVADQGSNIIRRVALDSGTVTTLAGSPLRWGNDDGNGSVARFLQPMGLALDGNRLFIADTGNQTIRSLDLLSGHVSTIAGQHGQSGNVDSTNGPETFNAPVGLAFDAVSGNLYVVDSGNDTVRQVILYGPNLGTGWVSTLRDASNAALSIIYGWGMASDGKGALYVGSAAFGNVSKIVPGTPSTVTVLNDGTGAPAQLHAAQPVALDDAGRVYVGQDAPFPLESFVPGASAPTPLVDANTTADSLAFSDGTLYVGDVSTVSAVSTTTSPPALSHIAGRAAHVGNVDGAATQARFAAPTSIVYDGGAAYVLDAGNRSLRRLAWPSGDVTTLAVPSGSSSSMRRLYSLTSDGKGNLYFIDQDLIPYRWSIRKVVAATGEASTVFTAERTMGRLSALAADGAGNLYVAAKNAIVRIGVPPAPNLTLAGTPGTAGKSDGKGSQALFGGLQALVWDGAGTLYAADNSAIRSVALADGTTTTIAGVADQAGDLDGIGSGARLGLPQALAFDPDGVLFFTDGTTVRRLDVKSGAVVTWIGTSGLAIVRPGPLPAAVNQPGGLAVVAHGELLLTDSNENAVLHVR
jgi:sugar lactone lactonase YvrE